MLIVYINQEFRVLKKKKKYKDNVLFSKISLFYLITISQQY